MIVVQDDLWLCVDCLMFACNGDTSGITDYPNEPDARIKRVEDGVAALGPHLVPDFDSETEEGIREFSSCGCDACGSRLAGTMHRFAVLGTELDAFNLAWSRYKRLEWRQNRSRGFRDFLLNAECVD